LLFVLFLQQENSTSLFVAGVPKVVILVSAPRGPIRPVVPAMDQRLFIMDDDST
jgi:hypothetical protein